MNFYKIFDKESNQTKIYNLDIVQCFFIDDDIKTVDFFYGADEFVQTPLTNELIKKLKEIGVLKNDEKEVKKVSLICDRCGKPFKYNVLFDKNGVSVNTIKTPLLCSKCICGDSKNE
jgi:transposase